MTETDSNDWFLRHGNVIKGPVPLSYLVKAYKGGLIEATAPIRHHLETTWTEFQVAASANGYTSLFSIPNDHATPTSKNHVSGIAVATGVVGATLIASKALAQPEVVGTPLLKDVSGNGVVDLAAYDTNLDGIDDIAFADINSDGMVDVITNDRNFDGVADEILVDTNADGIIDLAAFDNNLDGVVDSVAMDTSGDGLVDLMAFDTNGDCLLDNAIMDLNHDGFTDAIAFDMDGDGILDSALLDVDHDGIFDAVGELDGLDAGALLDEDVGGGLLDFLGDLFG